MIKPRSDFAPPQAIEEWGWEYHHLGIPTDKKMPNEKYLPEYKFYVSGFDISPYGVEWMRFEKDSPISTLVQTVPHLAFVVQDLEEELSGKGFRIISEPSTPSKGIRVAMIEHNGAPIELMEFINH